MDVRLSEEQALIRDSLARYLASEYDIDARRRAVASEAGWDARLWRQLGQELGILAAPFAEDFGGLGGQPLDLLVLAEELGRGLLIEPYLSTVLMAGWLLEQHGNEDQQKLLGQVASGDLVIACGLYEAEGRYDPSHVTTRAVADGQGGFVVDGAKALVYAAPWASHLIFSARTDGAVNDSAGITVFVIEKDRPGVSLRGYPTVDGYQAAELSLRQVQLDAGDIIGTFGGGHDLIEQVIDRATAAICGEALGVLGRLYEDTLAYARERRQFGRRLADFQVLRHRIADLWVTLEEARSMAAAAVLSLGAAPAARRRAVSAAKLSIGEACRFIGQQAIQIHGAIGITEELALGAYFKRAMVIERQFGPPDFHLRRYRAAAAEAEQ